jgi:hypothetical protein
VNDAVARRIARFGSGWIPWGSAFADLPTAIKMMKDKVLAHGGDPSDLQVQGNARAVKGDDGSIDYTASAASVPALVAAGVTDVRFTVAVPADGDRAVEVLSSLVEAFRDVTRELPASPNRAEVKRSCMQLRDHDGSQVLFHPLDIRRAGRIAWCEPSNWVRFVQFDQQSPAASDFASASHPEGPFNRGW